MLKDTDQGPEERHPQIDSPSDIILLLRKQGGGADEWMAI